MSLKRLLSEEQYTDKANGEVGTFHCSVQTNSRTKREGEISEKIFLRENTDLNGNKGSCNSKEGKALSDSEYMLPMK